MGKMVSANGIQLWCEGFGNPADPTILLIMGLGGQGFAWPEPLCQALVAGGRHVIRYDNRDVGRSSQIDFSTNPYKLADMADDAIGLLDAFGIPAAHFVGASMGGMIAQEAAINHPDRVLTLTSWMSTPAARDAATGGFSDGLPRSLPKVDELQAWMAANPAKTRDEEIDVVVKLVRTFSGTGTPFDEAAIRVFAGMALDAGTSPAAGALGSNQTLAVAASPARTGRLGRITAPTLVVHGVEDPVLRIEHAEATAKAIAGAKLLRLEGVGHEMPAPILPIVASAILEHTALSGAAALAAAKA